VGAGNESVETSLLTALLYQNKEHSIMRFVFALIVLILVTVARWVETSVVYSKQ